MKNRFSFAAVAASIFAIVAPASADNALYLNCECKTATDSVGGGETCADFSAIVDIEKNTLQWNTTSDQYGPHLAEISSALISALVKGGPDGKDNSREDRIGINRVSGAFSWVMTFYTPDHPPDIHTYYDGMCTRAEGPKF